MNDLTIQQPECAVAGVETASGAAAAQAKALVEARYIIAIRRPRDMDAVRERMRKECLRPSFAAVARYRKPIGKDESKWPTGPSIRFIESCIRNMTNVTVETMIVYDDATKRIVKVSVTDLEANVPYTQDIPVAKTIERRATKDGDVVVGQRTNSYGDKLFILQGTDEDILNKQAALISKAIRTLGQRLVPGDLVDECMELVMKTQMDADAQDPDAAKRKLFDSFGAQGVRVDQLKEYLGHDAETLSPKEMQDLRMLWASIRDGEATWRDVMDTRETAERAATGLDRVKAAIRPAAAAKGKKGAAAAPAVDPATGETGPPPAAPAQAAAQTASASKPEAKPEVKPAALDEAGHARALQSCRTVDDLDIAADALREIPEGEMRDRLVEIFKARRAALA